MKMLFVLVAVAALSGAAVGGGALPEVWSALQTEEDRADVWIQLPNMEFNPLAPLDHLGPTAQSMTRNERRVAHVNALMAFAEPLQAPLAGFLEARGADFKKFWITNAFIVRGASRALIFELEAGFPYIAEMYLERMASIDVPVSHQIDNGVPKEAAAAGGAAKRAQWNIEMVNAPAAWAQGYNGTGYVQGNIDTGVLWEHEALIGNYRGGPNGMNTHDYNWFNPVNPTSFIDNNGHGTHVMGTQVGSFESEIGVAPGSTWICAKGCASSSCSQSDLTASGQFMAAPCRVGGGDCDPTLAPDVIQNSWGGGGGQTWFHPIIDSWLVLDIVPSFSAGNSGSGCNTIGSPSDYIHAISVASCDSNKALSSFSSRGPGRTTAGFTRQKPDLTGPGSSIRSAWNSGTTAYNTISGTSMSGPHIASATTIILGALDGAPCPGSDRQSCSDAMNCPCVEFVRDVGEKSASPDYSAPTGGQTSCDGVHYGDIPNMHYGWGLLDLEAAVAMTSKAAKTGRLE